MLWLGGAPVLGGVLSGGTYAGAVAGADVLGTALAGEDDAGVVTGARVCSGAD